jgi:biotin carboxylase
MIRAEAPNSESAVSGRRILLLSTTTGYQLRSFNDAAQRLGVYLVFATDRCHQLDDPWRDRAIAVRFHEEASALEAIVREARSAPFLGLLTVGDRPTKLAASVAQCLGLLGHTPDAAAASSNKLETRTRFAAAGLEVPWYFTVPIRGNGHSEARDPRTKYPCVLKPIGLSGSRGVIRANTPREFVAAFKRIRTLLERLDVRAVRTGFEDVMLIEGFIPGREVAVEGVLTAGRLQVFAIFDKPDPLDGPFFEETIYVTPSSLDATTQAALMSTIEQATDALGLWHGPIHAECRINDSGIVVLEIAARPIGGLCSRALRFAGGTPLEEILLRHALGEDVSHWAREPVASAVMMIPIPRRGVLRRVDGQDEARAVPGVDDVQITAKPDQLLEPLPEAGSYLGFIFARAQSAAGAETAVRAAHARLSFVIDPAIDVVSATS